MIPFIRLAVIKGIPGPEVEPDGSYAATNRRPLDWRAMTPRAV
jgi:hypothetical protein